MTKAQLIELAGHVGFIARPSWTKARITDVLNTTLTNLERAITRAIDHHEHFSNAYFWSPPGQAAARRAMERNKSFAERFLLDGSMYAYESSVRCSCKNVYYHGTFLVDGVKKNVRCFRAALARVTQLKKEVQS